TVNAVRCLLALGLPLGLGTRGSAEMYPKPTISLSPSRVIALGQDVTIWCQAGRRDARFSLFKVGDWTLPGHVEPAGAGGEFLIHSMRQGDRGSYYHYATDPFAWSEPSDPEELVAHHSDTPNLPSPCAPVGGSPWGGAVTVRCRGRHQNARFLLYKDGNPIVLQDVEPAGDVAEFPIRNMSQGDPSDPRELVVAGEGPVPALTPAPLSHTPSYLSSLLPGSRDGVTAGSPARGKQKLLEVWGSLGGISAPRGNCRAGGLSHGDVPPATSTLGMHRGVGGPGAAQPAPSPDCNNGWVSAPSPRGLGAQFHPSPIPANARFNPTEGTTSAGPQQPDSYPRQSRREKVSEKIEQFIPQGTGLPAQTPTGPFGPIGGGWSMQIEGDGQIHGAGWSRVGGKVGPWERRAVDRWEHVW
uniref:Ig-like domain-containing protein n=1 Tax=Chelonoidis abingdonii TaxID=106734 RepID=A0A8C0IU16_CHEAB